MHTQHKHLQAINTVKLFSNSCSVQVRLPSLACSAADLPHVQRALADSGGQARAAF